MARFATNLLASKRIVISHPAGGLGDNLSLSTLPEMFAKYGIETYIHSKNAYKNEEIYDLVWERNPYVKGITDDEPNAGGCRELVVPKPGGGFTGVTEDLTLDFIARIEARHDLPPMNRYPSVYYTPRIIPELRETVLVDVGTVTMPSNIPALLEYLGFVVKGFGYDSGALRQARFSKQVATNNLVFLSDVGQYDVHNLMHYCDVLFSCRALITTHSGAHALAVALRRDRATPAIHCFCPFDQFNKGHFVFRNVRYYTWPTSG